VEKFSYILLVFGKHYAIILLSVPHKLPPLTYLLVCSAHPFFLPSIYFLNALIFLPFLLTLLFCLHLDPIIWWGFQLSFIVFYLCLQALSFILFSTFMSLLKSCFIYSMSFLLFSTVFIHKFIFVSTVISQVIIMRHLKSPCLVFYLFHYYASSLLWNYELLEKSCWLFSHISVVSV
jgi:hypothetical protein